jgi:hypothetical protein
MQDYGLSFGHHNESHIHDDDFKACMYQLSSQGHGY